MSFHSVCVCVSGVPYWVKPCHGIYIVCISWNINPLNPELNSICHLLALLGAHHILHVGRIRVNATKVPETTHCTGHNVTAILEGNRTQNIGTSSSSQGRVHKVA